MMCEKLAHPLAPHLARSSEGRVAIAVRDDGRHPQIEVLEVGIRGGFGHQQNQLCLAETSKRCIYDIRAPDRCLNLRDKRCRRPTVTQNVEHLFGRVVERLGNWACTLGRESGETRLQLQTASQGFEPRSY
jgi:hypothetical protein